MYVEDMLSQGLSGARSMISDGVSAASQVSIRACMYVQFLEAHEFATRRHWMLMAMTSAMA